MVTYAAVRMMAENNTENCTTTASTIQRLPGNDTRPGPPLSRLKKLKPGDIRGHLKIFENSIINHLIHIPKDRILLQYNFDPPYKLVIESSKEEP